MIPIRWPAFFALLAVWSVAAGAHSTTVIDMGRGPVEVYVPALYRSDSPAPLIMLLHGYSSSGSRQERYMEFLPLVDREGFIYLHPDGTRDRLFQRFWNATDACCDFDESQEDDSGYLRALINEITTIFSVDPDRVFIVGHSNGGFMAYRMACDHSDVVRGIVSLAGATYLDPDDCRPLHPVHVLQIHGTDDDVIKYEGGCLVGGPRCYPGAEATVDQWAGHNLCSETADDGLPPMDLDQSVPGEETTRRRYRTGCSAGGSSELWTIHEGGHIPSFDSRFARSVVDHLFSLEPSTTSNRQRRIQGARRGSRAGR
jgi:polyhydroxybutyrate depolymerase